MATEIEVIKNTGGMRLDLTLTQYFGGKENGVMLQVTQGTGGRDKPGYIQLTQTDALALAEELRLWTETA